MTRPPARAAHDRANVIRPAGGCWAGKYTVPLNLVERAPGPPSARPRATARRPTRYLAKARHWKAAAQPSLCRVDGLVMSRRGAHSGAWWREMALRSVGRRLLAVGIQNLRLGRVVSGQVELRRVKLGRVVPINDAGNLCVGGT